MSDAISYWRHEKTGDLYDLLMFAVDEDTLEPVVVYRVTHGKRCWVRPCAQFFDGRFRQAPTPKRKLRPERPEPADDGAGL